MLTTNDKAYVISGSREIDELLDAYDSRVKSKTNLSYSQYHSAVIDELIELNESSEEDQRDEFGDVLTNVLFMGAAIGIRDPLTCVMNCIRKVQKRFDFINERISSTPGDDGYPEEFAELWDRSKVESESP